MLRFAAHPEQHLIYEEGDYRSDGNVQITVDHLTYLLHRWLYEKIIGWAPRYLLPNCEEGKRCQNPYHRLPSKSSLKPQVHPPRIRATGEGMAAPELNRSKTHCPQNHEYTEENTYIWVDADGARHRKCRACTIKRTRLQHRAERIARKEEN